MSYTNSEVAHQWVHGLFGSRSEICGSNFSGNSKNLYSYSTVIAQCLDRVRNVFLVSDVHISRTTAKHLSYVHSAMPSDFTVIYTHFSNGGRFGNADLLGYSHSFDKVSRFVLVTHLLWDMYREYEFVVEGKSLDAENISKKRVDDIDKLNRIYGDCSLGQWLRHCKLPHASDRKSENFKLRKMVRLYLAGKTDEEIVDALFGNGTWDKMQQRIAPLKKAKQTKEKLDILRRHMFYSDGKWNSPFPECPYSAKSLRQLTPKQILKIRFHNLERIAFVKRNREKYKGSSAFDDKSASRNRAYKFVGLRFDGYRYCTDKVTKPNGRVIYRQDKFGGFVDNVYISPFAGFDDNTKIHFDYASFCAAPDKFVWRKRFWKMCELKMRRQQGAFLFNLRSKMPYYVMTDEENHIYNEFVIRRNNHERKIALREKAELARKARERQEKMQKIEAYRQHGYDGLRRLWIERIDTLSHDIMTSPELCYGGNVLLRFSPRKDAVETSLGIRLTFNECHKYWEVIKRWHDTGTFEECTRMAGYTVDSFDNDILKAGCHRIAFCEMQRMYDELCKLEAA